MNRAEVAKRVELLTADEKAQLATRVEAFEARSVIQRWPRPQVGVPAWTVPDLIERLSRIQARPAAELFRTVDTARPVYPICFTCGPDIWPGCHEPSMRSFDAPVKDFYVAHRDQLAAVALLYIDSSPVGTGFVVGDTLLTTNHGFGEHLKQRDGGWVTPPSMAFKLRFLLPQEREVLIPRGSKALMRADADAIAIRVPPEARSTWAPRFSAPTTGEGIIVAGYPLAAQEETSQDKLRRIFGACGQDVPWRSLTLSPGNIVAEPGDFVAYNANSYPGNSGSVVMRRSDGQIVGMHREAGRLWHSNHAVPAAVLQELLREAGRP